MASVIKAGNATDGIAISSDNTGILELKTGTGAGTTAVTIGTNQAVTFAGAVTSSGNQTVTGNLTVNGNTTLGDANTDTILMTAAPSIGGAGLGMGFGFRNRIINGAMVIDQRNAGASVTPTTSGYTLDRWFAGLSQASKYSVQRNAGSVTPPVGFTNYLGVTSLSAYSVLSGDTFNIQQRIEGFNVSDFGWGTANAQTVTLSFWVRSSITGTHSGALWNNAFNRSYPFTFAVSAANTWEQKSVTIAGDTSGTWTTDNTIGIGLSFNLGSGSSFLGTAGAWGSTGVAGATGSVSVVGTNGATFYITGVQLEKGSTATSFDVRPYGTELQLCQRYYVKWGINSDGGGYTSFGSGYVGSATSANAHIVYPVQMRATPTFAQSSCAVLEAGGAFAVTGFSATYAGQQSALLSCTVASGLTGGRGAALTANNTVSGNLTASAEL